MRHIRGQLGITQEEFAARLGVGRVAVARWETGAQSPRRHLEAIRVMAQEAVVDVRSREMGVAAAKAKKARQTVAILET